MSRTRLLVVPCSLVLICLAAGLPVRAALPPPPVPVENPITEAKRVLGKILFWDEQLSSDRTVACGTCHSSAAGGADPRFGVHPGPDEILPSPDDIFGSPGVIRMGQGGVPIEDPLFGFEEQVTPRSANTTLGAVFSPELFWDGRAPTVFVDPESGATSIAGGGALETQAVAPVVSDVEMAHEGRTWDDVRFQLVRSLPFRDATNLPADVEAALAGSPSYPDLFEAAFGDEAIDAERIAFAIATYERTLLADATPWDAFVAGNPTAMTPGQVAGWNFFNNSPCRLCHTPPFFTNHTFHNLGLRPPTEDPGRQEVTGLVQDRGRFKVPTLRNVGLKSTHMHNGRIDTVTDAVLWYRPVNPQRFTDNLDPAIPVPVPPNVLPGLVDFLTNALTDPRVAEETFPFDRPTLHGGLLGQLSFQGDASSLTWPALEGVQSYRIYRGDLASLHVSGPDGLPAAGYGTCSSGGDLATPELTDPESPPPGAGFFYLKAVVDDHGAERGLGATSEGKARQVLVPCPG